MRGVRRWNLRWNLKPSLSASLMTSLMTSLMSSLIRCAAEGGAVPVKLAVVGAGPAGMTAAIYAARAGLKPVVVAPSMGGQLMSKGVNVENYPGIFEASGGDIVRLMKKQV